MSHGSRENLSTGYQTLSDTHRTTLASSKDWYRFEILHIGSLTIYKPGILFMGHRQTV